MDLRRVSYVVYLKLMEITLPNNVQEWLQSCADLQRKTIEETLVDLARWDFAESLFLHSQLTLKRKSPPPQWIIRVGGITRIVEDAEAKVGLKIDRKEDRRQKYLSAKLREIDYTVLEKGNSRSGYAGVHPNGKHGFRAFVTESGRGKHLRTRPDAALAAWDRYLWHRERGIPYGSSAKTVKQMLQGQGGADPEYFAASQDAM